MKTNNKIDKLKEELMKTLNLEQRKMLIELMIQMKTEQIKILQSFIK